MVAIAARGWIFSGRMAPKKSERRIELTDRGQQDAQSVADAYGVSLKVAANWCISAGVQHLPEFLAGLSPVVATAIAPAGNVPTIDPELLPELDDSPIDRLKGVLPGDF